MNINTFVVILVCLICGSNPLPFKFKNKCDIDLTDLNPEELRDLAQKAEDQLKQLSNEDFEPKYRTSLPDSPKPTPSETTPTEPAEENKPNSAENELIEEFFKPTSTENIEASPSETPDENEGISEETKTDDKEQHTNETSVEITEKTDEVEPVSEPETITDTQSKSGETNSPESVTANAPSPNEDDPPTTENNVDHATHPQIPENNHKVAHPEDHQSEGSLSSDESTSTEATPKHAELEGRKNGNEPESIETNPPKDDSEQEKPEDVSPKPEEVEEIEQLFSTTNPLTDEDHHKDSSSSSEESNDDSTSVTPVPSSSEDVTQEVSLDESSEKFRASSKKILNKLLSRPRRPDTVDTMFIDVLNLMAKYEKTRANCENLKRNYSAVTKGKGTTNNKGKNSRKLKPNRSHAGPEPTNRRFMSIAGKTVYKNHYKRNN